MRVRTKKYFQVSVVGFLALICIVWRFVFYQQQNPNSAALRSFDQESLESSKVTIKNVVDAISSLQFSNKEALLLNATRRLIESELKEHKLDGYMLETGGQPLRNLIISTWRSGSSFIGSILDSHPGTFYDYEPLMYFGINRARFGGKAEHAIRVLRERFDCNFLHSTHIPSLNLTLSHSSRVWKLCQSNDELCWNLHFLSRMCRLFPIQVVKMVRMNLGVARSVLQDQTLNIRLLYLVRDPRGTMQSRYKSEVCGNAIECADPAILCSDLLEDYHEARKLQQEFSQRFMVVRYEDLASDIYAGVEKIFKFLRLDYGSHVKEFLRTHTTSNSGGHFTLVRDTKAAPFHWMQDFSQNFTVIQNIQNLCRKALDVWGYNVVQDATQLLHFNPINNYFTWPLWGT